MLITCESYDIEKISVTSKAISGAALGVYSNNIRKKCEYKCNKKYIMVTYYKIPVTILL